MDQNEWNKSGKFPNKYEWYNQTRKIQKSLKFNKDISANVIHHLRDTEEQRKYNDEHYEFWGFNQDGTFEYGKYVIFVTKEEHDEIHRDSLETRQRTSEASKLNWQDENYRNNLVKKMYESWTYARKEHISKIRIGRCHSEESKKKMSDHNWCKGKHLPDEIKKKISKSEKGKKIEDWHRQRVSYANKGKILSDETKQKMRVSKMGALNPRYNKLGTMLGRHQSDEARRKLSEAKKGKILSAEHRQAISNSQQRIIGLYNQYKESGGLLKWNDFRKSLKNN